MKVEGLKINQVNPKY